MKACHETVIHAHTTNVNQDQTISFFGPQHFLLCACYQPFSIQLKKEIHGLKYWLSMSSTSVLNDVEHKKRRYKKKKYLFFIC